MLAENGTQLLSPVQLITYQFNLLIRFRFTNEREKTCSLAYHFNSLYPALDRCIFFSSVGEKLLMTLRLQSFYLAHCGRSIC